MKENMEEYYEHLHSRVYDREYLTEPVKADSLLFIGGREGLDLGGEWHFMPDVFDTVTRKKLFGPWKRDEEGRLIPNDYEPGNGIPVNVPGCWNTASEKLWYFEGTGVYSRTFHADPGKGRKILYIGAANYECRIFVNGIYAGRHIGGFTPFAVDITEYIREENTLMLLVNNTRRFEAVPSENFDWFNYGGITREIMLYTVPERHIRDFRISLVPDGTFSRIKVSAETEGDGDVTLSIPGLSINVRFRGETVIETSPRLWSPEDPYLYDVSLSFGVDRVSDKIGFREIRREGKKILLNGKEIFLKGICCHEESSSGGRTLSDDERLQILRTARDLGCNALRLTHYPHSGRMAQLADQEGILLWEEIPVYWLIDFANKETFLNASNQLRELIRRDYNRASAIIWSVGNENPDTDERYAFMKGLADTAREMDDTRLISAACLVNIDRMAVSDRLSEVVDIVSFNEYYGWYFRDYEGVARILENTCVDKPLMITETGAGAKAGYHGGDEELFTEEHQAKVYRKQIEYTDGKIQGLFPWILFDFESPIRMNPYQEDHNIKGVAAKDKKTRKMAFSVLQKYYRSR